MANDNDQNNSQLSLPAIVALFFVLLAGWLIWVTQVKMPQEQSNAERLATVESQLAEMKDTAAEEAAQSGAEAAAPVDMEAAIAAAEKGGCAACHTIPGIPNAQGQVGPDLTNIGADAAARIDGYSAEEYIHESIANPLAFTAPECPTGPCPPGAMPPLGLDEAEIEALVSYLVTLGGQPVAQAEPDETADEEATTPTEVAEPAPVALDPLIEPVAPAEFTTAFAKGGCAGCHTIPGIPGANGQVGPDLSEIGANAAARISGASAEDYIRQSILEPNAFIAPECPLGDCPENVMLQSFAESLTEADLDNIVEYLSALGTDKAIALSEPSAELLSLDTSLPAESVLEPFIPLPQEPADEAQIALGKYLFFDPRLSNNNSVSCATCHQPDKAFADGEVLNQGYPSTQYFRNAPSVYNTVYNDYLYWDGRMDGNDLPTLVRDHIAEAHFMSNDGRLMWERLKQVPAYVEAYNAVFGSEPGYGNTLNAIAAYVRTLNTPTTPYDQYLAGDAAALSAEAQAGLALFEGQAGCSGCHSGELLSNGDFYNIGVATDPAMFEDPELHVTFRRFFRTLGTPNYRNLREDVGLYALTLDEEDWGKFRTPGLREVGRTAPYMHNGSLTTLEDVVRFYNEGGGENQTAGLQPLDLTDEEVAQLVAFLESLSSEPIEVEAPILPDYQLLTLGGSE